MRPATTRPRRVAERRRRATRSWRRPRWRTAAASLALATALAACGGADDSAERSMQDQAAADLDGVESVASPEMSGMDGEVAGGAAEDTDEAGTDPASTGDGQAPDGTDRAPRGEQVIRDAAITLELADTEDALREVRAVAERGGGTVATADLRRDRPAGDLGGTIVLRVPSGELLATLEALEELAVDAPVRRIDERDVTGEVIDLRARVTNLTAYEAELRELLTEIREGASDPDRLLPVFERVNEVRSQIDRLTAQRDELVDRVARSTITVTVRPAPGTEPVATPTWAPATTMERAVATSVSALTTLADAVIWLVVVALPLVALVVAPLLLGARAWRRRRPDPATATAPAAAPAGQPVTAAGATPAPPGTRWSGGSSAPDAPPPDTDGG